MGIKNEGLRMSLDQKLWYTATFSSTNEPKSENAVLNAFAAQKDYLGFILA